MVDDIVPELLSSIQNDFEKNYRNSNLISKAMEELKNKKADYVNANEYAIEVGKALVDAFSLNISATTLPDGKMYYNIGKRLLENTLGKNHELIASYTNQVQSLLNEQAKISVNVKVPALNQDRINGIVNRLSYEESFDEVEWLLKEPIITYSQSIVDETIKANFEFQGEIGLNPIIVRKSVGKCCAWCQRLVGIYNYSNVPKDIYHRHNHCRCPVEYYPTGIKGGNKQNVHSKLKSKVGFEERQQLASLIEQDRKLNNERLKRIANAKAVELGLSPLSDDKVVETMRLHSKEWIDNLNDFEKNSIRKYTDNGTDKDGMKLFQKMNGYLDRYYIPINQHEEQMLEKNIANLQLALLQNKIKEDIIVYRNDTYKELLNGKNSKFLSCSVTQHGTIGKKPNVAIIVPSGSNGGYVELLSNYPNQREFIIPIKSELEKVFSDSEILILRMKVK